MKNLETFEKQYLEKIKQTRKIPSFKPGDTLIVHVKIKEKKRERNQAFEGICFCTSKGLSAWQSFKISSKRFPSLILYLLIKPIVLS